MSDKAAKMIMYGLIALACSIVFQVGVGPETNRYHIRHPKKIGLGLHWLFDSKSGDLYYRNKDDDKWLPYAEL